MNSEDVSQQLWEYNEWSNNVHALTLQPTIVSNYAFFYVQLATIS